jgi:hypothetical protein
MVENQTNARAIMNKGIRNNKIKCKKIIKSFPDFERPSQLNLVSIIMEVLLIIPPCSNQA